MRKTGFGSWIFLGLVAAILSLPLLPINRFIITQEDPVARANWFMLEVAGLIFIFAIIQGQVKEDARAKRGIGEVVGFLITFMFLAGLIALMGKGIAGYTLPGTDTEIVTNPFLVQIWPYIFAYNIGYWPSRSLTRFRLGIKPDVVQE